MNKFAPENLNYFQENDNIIRESENEKNFTPINFEENNINSEYIYRNAKKTKSIIDKNYLIVKEHYDEDKYEFIEEELFVRGEGYCFGEWALIYNQPRSASIYTLEDCVFFTLGETPFKDSFLKSLNNCEFEKKKFALQNFLPFNMVNHERQLSIYKNIIPITCERNQIIFNEGDFSDSIFLIYLGNFTLEKSYKNKKFKVLNLEKGSIVGLESLFETEKKQYKCTLKLSTGYEFGIVFKLKLNKLRPYIVKQMKISFKENYNLFLKSWRELFKKIILVNQSVSNKFLQESLEVGNDKLIFDNIEIEENIVNIYKAYNNSILDMKMKKNYEDIFKESFKKIDYENRKKDGSLRIFSSTQRSRIYDKDSKNNNNFDNINIIKYFKKFMKKSEYERRNLKTAYPLRIRGLNDFSTINSNRKKSSKNLSLVIINGQNKHINKRYLKTDNNLINTSEQKENVNTREKKFKLNFSKSLKKFYLKASTVDNNNNNIKENDRYKINNKNELIESNDINKKNENPDLNIKNNNTIKKDLIKQKENVNLNISKLKQNIINKLKENKQKIKKLPYNNLKYGNIGNKNSKNKNNLKNNTFLSFHENKQLKKNLSSKDFFISSRNNIKAKILLKDKINAKKTLKKSFSQKEYKYFLEKSNNTTLIIDKDKLSISKNKSSNNIFKTKSSDKQSSCKKVDSFLEDNSNLFKEFNLNNGFSVSYFKSIKPINEFRNYEIIHKKKIFPPTPNKFKIAFNSGDFNIPLVSSFLKLK